MYKKISGEDFSGLISRQFDHNGANQQNNTLHSPYFDCSSSILVNQHFHILHIKADFRENMLVQNMNDSDHLSLHFQLKGYSNARISGFEHTQSLKQYQTRAISCCQIQASYEFPAQKNYEYVTISVKPSIVPSLLATIDWPAYQELALANQSFSITEHAQPFLAEQLQVIQQLLNNPFPNDLQERFQFLKIAELLLWYKSIPATYPIAKSPISASDQEKLWALKDFLDIHYLEPLAVHDLPKIFLLNDFKLKTGFKALFNTTPYQYILELRMQYARQCLLDQPNYSIDTLAEKLHYSTKGHFMTAFRKRFGRLV